MYPLKILDDLTVRPGEAVSITGTGGKTTLLWYLAGLAAMRGRVIVGPTAKMLPLPEKDPRCARLITDPRNYDPEKHPDHTIQQVGAGLDPRGKLLGLDEETVKSLKAPDRFLLLEADGSRGLPLKMWYPHEPAVFPSGELTLGILPITALGLPVTPKTAYNPEGFRTLTGLKTGDLCSPEALREMVLSPQALFKNSKGRLILLINQCDGDELFRKASGLADEILLDPRSSRLHSILCVSLKEFHHGNYRHYSCRRLIPANETK